MPPKKRSRRYSSPMVKNTAKPEELVVDNDFNTELSKRKREDTPPLVVQGSRKRKPSRRLLESNVMPSVTGRARNYKPKHERIESSSDESGNIGDKSDLTSSTTKESVQLTNNTVYLEDVVNPSFIPPATDETKVDRRDTLFRKTYDNVVNLPATSLLTSRQGRSAQTASLDMWYQNGGSVNVNFLRELYMFAHHDSYVNLSRVDPRILSTRRVSSLTKNSGLIFANCARQESTYVILYNPRRPFTLNGPGLRVIEGDFLVQEFERLLGCLGVVYNTSTFGFDLFTSHFQFRTYVDRQFDGRADDVSRTPDKSTSKYAVTVASPRSIATSSPARLAIPATEQIPVYDFTSRIRPFDPTIDLYPEKTNAPLYDRDIPEGSLALVAYTVNTYDRKTDLSARYLSFNVHWAALIGTPGS
ncbi:hypothetical protein L210DRAFT_3511578 [Boletus edulis BED1]|uniref:Uncharacterized protein n=1 Tax=Boletus edulis BED1 TaxID=1328754 RepID=A0AAD4BC71_BOLED|nr:hypothetical protein L210DRAFT_3511578 [Boletus edulis BED1]